MAQEYADKAQANINFNPYQRVDNTTQGDKETAKGDHMFRRDRPLSEYPFIKIPVFMKPNKHV